MLDDITDYSTAQAGHVEAEKEKSESPGSWRGGEFILGHMASHGLFRDVARVRSCNAMSGERKIVEMNISIRVLNRGESAC